MEQTAPVLSVSGLLDLSHHLDLVCLVLTGDLDSSNVRVKWWYGDRLRQSASDGKCVVLVDSCCLAHVINTIGRVAFRKNGGLVPNLHSVAHSLNDLTRSAERQNQPVPEPVA